MPPTPRAGLAPGPARDGRVQGPRHFHEPGPGHHRAVGRNGTEIAAPASKRKDEKVSMHPADDIDPNRLAAILYRPEDDVDTLLADFAEDRLRLGERLGGLVQRNLKDDRGEKVGMRAIDLLTRREISLCQDLGSGSTACKLDSAALAEASLAVVQAIDQRVDLIVVNKFSKQEADGKGLRHEIAAAIATGIPLLTAVPEKRLDAWTAFTGDVGAMLLCESLVVHGWWRDLSIRIGANAAFRPGADRRAISRSSHPTI
jgi:molybdate transport system ATP-binding protein